MGKDSTHVKAGSSRAKALEERIAFIQEYIKLWRQFFETFAEGLENRKILKKDEEEFARILNSLAHHHYRFAYTADKEMSGTDGIIKILCETTSLSHLKGLSEAQLGKVQLDWHEIFINMNKALGRWMARRPLTPEEQALAKRGGVPPPADTAPPPEAQPSEPGQTPS